MGKVLGFMAGAVCGTLVGAVVVLLFTPASGAELIRGAEERWQLTLEEARNARLAKQRELEEQFEQAKQM